AAEQMLAGFERLYQAYGTGSTLHPDGVRAAKTSTSRQVPVCRELAELLQQAFDVADPGASWIIVRYRERNSNLRTQFHRIIKRAGLNSLPRTFHNLRASCPTE